MNIERENNRLHAQAFRKRQQEKGLKRVCLYVHLDDVQAMKDYAAKLNKKREN